MRVGLGVGRELGQYALQSIDEVKDLRSKRPVRRRFHLTPQDERELREDLEFVARPKPSPLTRLGREQQARLADLARRCTDYDEVMDLAKREGLSLTQLDKVIAKARVCPNFKEWLPRIMQPDGRERPSLFDADLLKVEKLLLIVTAAVGRLRDKWGGASLKRQSKPKVSPQEIVSTPTPQAPFVAYGILKEDISKKEISITQGTFNGRVGDAFYIGQAVKQGTTPDAVEIYLPAWDRVIWVPRKAMAAESELKASSKRKQKGALIIAAWVAHSNKLIDETVNGAAEVHLNGNGADDLNESDEERLPDSYYENVRQPDDDEDNDDGPP